MYDLCLKGTKLAISQENKQISRQQDSRTEIGPQTVMPRVLSQERVFEIAVSYGNYHSEF